VKEWVIWWYMKLLRWAREQNGGEDGMRGVTRGLRSQERIPALGCARKVGL